MCVIWFLIGVLVGAVWGLFIAVLFEAAARGDRWW